MPTDPTSWALERRATTAHGQIAWDRLGKGPSVVLVHGTPSRSVLWRDVAPRLAERFTVYVFDLLGFGQSERHERQQLSIRVHGEVLAELVDLWNIPAPVLVGHDIGGAAVLRAHLLHAVPARKLALIDAVVLAPWITATTRHIKAHLDVYQTMPTHIFREVAAAHLRTATAQPMPTAVFAAYFDQWGGERGHRLWLRNVAGFDKQDATEFEPLLGGMQTPVRVVWGEHDRWLPLEVSAEIQARLPTPTGSSSQTQGTSPPRTSPPRSPRRSSSWRREARRRRPGRPDPGSCRPTSTALESSSPRRPPRTPGSSSSPSLATAPRWLIARELDLGGALADEPTASPCVILGGGAWGSTPPSTPSLRSIAG
ncbi:MAG: alpha/beta fold hydrolase [Egibacteraceae bacterium]